MGSGFWMPAPKSLGTGCPWENMYAHDLVIISELLEKMQENLMLWKTNMEENDF